MLARTPRSSRLLRWSAAAAITATMGLGAATSAFAATVNVNTITIGSCVSSPSISGSVLLKPGQTASATLTLELQYQNPAPFMDTGLRTTATFNNSNSASYSFSFNGTPAGNSYRVVIVSGPPSWAGLTTKSASVPPCSSGGGGGGGGGTDTPELGSGELLATGLLPIGAILLYRRSRRRR